MLLTFRRQLLPSLQCCCCQNVNTVSNNKSFRSTEFIYCKILVCEFNPLCFSCILKLSFVTINIVVIKDICKALITKSQISAVENVDENNLSSVCFLKVLCVMSGSCSTLQAVLYRQTTDSKTILRA